MSPDRASAPRGRGLRRGRAAARGSDVPVNLGLARRHLRQHGRGERQGQERTRPRECTVHGSLPMAMETIDYGWRDAAYHDCAPVGYDAATTLLRDGLFVVDSN